MAIFQQTSDHTTPIAPKRAPIAIKLIKCNRDFHTINATTNTQIIVKTSEKLWIKTNPVDNNNPTTTGAAPIENDCTDNR